MAFEGSCHCGKVAFAVDAEPPAKAYSCNCSHCRTKGFLLSFFPPEQFTLLRGADELKSYFFHKHAIEHMFCATCGAQPLAMGKLPDGSPMRAVNLRCVAAIDLDALELIKVDGAQY